MKLLILFITLILGVSLNLLANNDGETGKRPTEVKDPAKCLNNCPTPEAPGSFNADQCKTLALTDKNLPSVSPKDIQDLQKACNEARLGKDGKKSAPADATN